MLSPPFQSRDQNIYIYIFLLLLTNKDKMCAVALLFYWFLLISMEHKTENILLISLCLKLTFSFVICRSLRKIELTWLARMTTMMTQSGSTRMIGPTHRKRAVVDISFLGKLFYPLVHFFWRSLLDFLSVISSKDISSYCLYESDYGDYMVIFAWLNIWKKKEYFLYGSYESKLCEKDPYHTFIQM